MSDEVDSLSGSQRGSGKEKKCGLHLEVLLKCCKATAEEEVICATLGTEMAFISPALYMLQRAQHHNCMWLLASSPSPACIHLAFVPS